MDTQKYIDKLKSKDNFKNGDEVVAVFQEMFKDFMREAKLKRVNLTLIPLKRFGVHR